MSCSKVARRLTVERLTTLLEDYGSSAEVARRLGVSRKTIWRARKRLGVPLENPTGWMRRTLSTVPTERLRYVWKREGESAAQAAKVFGVHRATFALEMRKRGLPLRVGRSPVFPWTDEWLRTEVGRESVPKVAAKWGLTESAIYAQCYTRGIAIPQRRGPVPIRPRLLVASEAELRAMYLGERMSTRAIGARLGVNDSTVRRRLVELGIPRRSHAEWLALGQGRRGRVVKSLTSPADMVQRTA